MKGGVVLALGVLRALAARREPTPRPRCCWSATRSGGPRPFAHTERFAGWDACLCFEAGELTPEGAEGVVVRRKAAGTIEVQAHGRASHSGSAPDRGRNALLALAAAAQAVAACHDPAGPARLTAVPTVLNAGTAFNVVPGRGALFCDLRADADAAILGVLDAVPRDVGGVRLEPALTRLWPGMDAEEPTPRPARGRDRRRSGRPILGVRRGGASDASHIAKAIPLTVDGLGPSRRQGAQPGRVRAGRVAAQPGRGGAGGGRGGGRGLIRSASIRATTATAIPASTSSHQWCAVTTTSRPTNGG